MQDWDFVRVVSFASGDVQGRSGVFWAPVGEIAESYSRDRMFGDHARGGVPKPQARGCSYVVVADVLFVSEWRSHDAMHDFGHEYGERFNDIAGVTGEDWEDVAWRLSDAMSL